MDKQQIKTLSKCLDADPKALILPKDSDVATYIEAIQDERRRRIAMRSWYRIRAMGMHVEHMNKVYQSLVADFKEEHRGLL